MSKKSHSSLHSALLCIQFATVHCQDKLYIYSGSRFDGNITVIALNNYNQCQKINVGNIKSVSSDFCVLLYATENCSGRWVKQVKSKDKASLEKHGTRGQFHKINSWFPCNKTFNGGPINVYVNKPKRRYLRDITSAENTEYVNVCECSNFGEYNGAHSGNKAAFISTGRCIKIFNKKYCEGESQDITFYAGPYPYPLYIFPLRPEFGLAGARSFRPCVYQSSCPLLNGRIYKIELFSKLSKQNLNKIAELSIPIVATNVANRVEFLISLSYTDSVASETPKGLQKIHYNISVEPDILFPIVNCGIPILNTAEWQEEFLQSLHKPFGTDLINRVSRHLNRKVFFKTTRPRLNNGHYNATAQLVIQERFELSYILHMKVTGTRENEINMTVNEIQQEFSKDAKYVSKLSNYEVDARVHGNITASFLSATKYNITAVTD